MCQRLHKYLILSDGVSVPRSPLTDMGSLSLSKPTTPFGVGNNENKHVIYMFCSFLRKMLSKGLFPVVPCTSRPATDSRALMAKLIRMSNPDNFVAVQCCLAGKWDKKCLHIMCFFSFLSILIQLPHISHLNSLMFANHVFF